MDISSFESKEHTFELVNPVDESGLGWHFTLRSPDSDEVRKVERDWQNKRLARRKMTLTAESIEAGGDAKIQAAVTGWRFDEGSSFEGGKPEFSSTKLREIIRNPKYRWIRNQLDQELGDASSFFTN